MRLKGSPPEAFAVAEVPKHEIRSPHDWLFPPGISRRTDSCYPLTGTPDRLTFYLDECATNRDLTRELAAPTTDDKQI
jgi:hypothetical protein